MTNLSNNNSVVMVYNVVIEKDKNVTRQDILASRS